MKNSLLLLIVLLSFGLGYFIGIHQKSPVDAYMQQCVKTLDAETCIMLYAKGGRP